MTREDAKHDLFAGLTVAVMLVPQAMAYAMLAGLPPRVGLYAAIVPLAVYAVLGTSRQLSVGPVATDSLLTAAGIAALHPSTPEQYIAYAVLLALMVGLLQTAMGLFRLGFLTNFLSRPVLSGFTSAAALVIGFSQLRHLLGVDMPRTHHVHTILAHAARQADEVSGLTVAIGLGAVAVLALVRRLGRRIPGALVVVVLGTLVVFFGGLEQQGVQIVKDVPGGMPRPALPAITWAAVEGLLPTAVTLAFVGFMEAISVSKVLADRHRYEVVPNQELVALGLANVAGAFFSAYPVAGGFSRSAVNDRAGATSGLSSLVTAGLVAVTLMFLTPLFYYLPKAVLAAIIMTAVFGLVDVAQVRYLWRVKRSDLGLLVVTFVATLWLGIGQGILTGVVASMLWFVVSSTRPHFAVLGRLPGGAYRNVANHAAATTFPGLLVVRMDAAFYYGNISFLRERLEQLEAESKDELQGVVIDASAMNHLDSSADAALHALARAYCERGVKLMLAEVKGPVLRVLEHSGFVARFGEDTFFSTVDLAVEAGRARLGGGARTCPRSAA